MSFGIVIATCNMDYHYAQATYCSIRYFCGSDIPICFIVDGNTDLLGKVLVDKNIIVLDRKSITNSWLREHCFGWGTTKLIAFYEVPFDRFLYLDADALVLGDVSTFDMPTVDMVVDCGQTYSDQDINFWFFNTEYIEKFYPDFNWRHYRNKYFCTGTFFSRRGIFSLENLKEKMKIAQQIPECFHFGEMGLLNLMIFEAEQKKELITHSVNYQIIPVDHEDSILQQRYSPQALIMQEHDKAVIHCCGKKANIFSNSPKVSLMNYFRLRYLVEREGYSILRAIFIMLYQDIKYVFFSRIMKTLRKIKYIYNIK